VALNALRHSEPVCRRAKFQNVPAKNRTFLGNVLPRGIHHKPLSKAVPFASMKYHNKPRIHAAAAAVLLALIASGATAWSIRSRAPPAFAQKQRVFTHIKSRSGAWFPRWPLPASLQNDDEYFRLLTQAAKDPATFEAFVNGNSTSTAAVLDAPPPIEKTGYVPIEQWNQNETRSQWDQQAQFDGLRHGNAMRQNDILQRHLKGF
jgi:hypothetical protein